MVLTHPDESFQQTNKQLLLLLSLSDGSMVGGPSWLVADRSPEGAEAAVPRSNKSRQAAAFGKLQCITSAGPAHIHHSLPRAPASHTGKIYGGQLVKITHILGAGWFPCPQGKVSVAYRFFSTGF